MSIHSMAWAGVEQITLTGNLPYTLPVGLPPNRVHSVVFTQDAIGGHTVTFAGQPVAVGLAAGASTVVELHPVAGGHVVRYSPAASEGVPKVYYVEAYQSLFGGAGGAFPDARWANATHLTAAGLALWAAHILDGSPIPTSGAAKVVWFGDSWISQNPTVLATATTTHNPDATVVVSGVGGNKSDDMIARFAADVPTDADFVIVNEPGVNDVYAKLTAQGMADNLETLIGLVREIGAVPIIAGQVPLSEYLTRSRSADLLMQAQISGGGQYPGISLPAVLDTLLRTRSVSSQALGIGAQDDASGAACTAFGYYSQYRLTTGASNTAFGALAQYSLTSGAGNTAIGAECQYMLTTGVANSAFGSAAQRNITSGGYNCGVGQATQNALTTGNSNTSIGAYAHLSLTAGSDNVAIGKGAGYDPGGVTANATTTAGGQTCVGAQSGLGSPTQSWYITCLGYRTKATAAGGVAIGVDSGGASAAAVAANDFVLGTANHKVKVPGRLNVARQTPTGTADTQGAVGDIASDDSYIYVKTNAGWKRAALATW